MFVGVGGLLAFVVPFILYFRERADRIAAQREAKELRDRAAKDAMAHQARRFAVWVEDRWLRCPTALCFASSTAAMPPIFGATIEVHVGASVHSYAGAAFGVDVGVVPPAVGGTPMEVGINSEQAVQDAIGAVAADRGKLFFGVGNLEFFDAAQRSWRRDENDSLILLLGHGKQQVIDKG